MAAASDSAAHRRSLVLRTIYALCLIGATYNHWVIIYQHGLFWNYGGFPKVSSRFWTALAFVDPATAVLLFKQPNVGVLTTAAIIMADVVHNVWIQAHYFPPLFQALAGSPQVIEQIAFMAFVVATCPFAWTSR